MAKTNPDIEWALSALEKRRADYERYRDYYDGRHKLGFATPKFFDAFGYLFDELAENLCPTVVGAVRDRLKLVSFTAEKKNDLKALSQIWIANRLSLRAGPVHLSALKFGDAYAIVWDNPDAAGASPVIHPNDPLHVVVAYAGETPGRITKAARQWTSANGQVRLNLYYADRIEKYVAGAAQSALAQTVTEGAPATAIGSFKFFRGDNDSGMVPNPYNQVPVFHFANDADLGEFGRSELKDVIPLQDALNKEVADMLVASEFVAMPQRWATGLEIALDPETKKPIHPFQTNRLWAVGDKEVEFGQFASADLSHYVAVQDKFIEKIARVSGIPLHYFIHSGGTPPSGESLKTLDARLAAKTYDRQVSYGSTWEQVTRFCLLIAGRSEVSVTANWEDTTPRDYGQAIEQAVTKREKLGFSLRQVVKELGYTDTEVDAFVSETIEAKAEEKA